MKWGINCSPSLLHVSFDAFVNQKKGLRATKTQHRLEMMVMNTYKFMNQQVKLKLKDAVRLTKRQKVSQQIQRGYDVARKWKDESEEDAGNP